MDNSKQNAKGDKNVRNAAGTAVFKTAGLSDIPLIRTLADNTFRDTYKETHGPDQLDWMMDMMYSVESLERQMTGGHTYYILYVDSRPCGYISISRQENNVFCFQKIYLLPDVQGKGWGRKLIEKGMEHVRNFGLPNTRVLLHVNRQNKARFFYEKMGFRIESSHDFYIGGGFYMNDYIMTIDI